VHGGVTWTFIWLMFLLKIPIGGLLWIVWWAIHQTTDTEAVDEGEGGSRVHRHRRTRPRGPRPRPRRGAHGVLPPPSPSRMRCVASKMRTLDCPVPSRASQRASHLGREVPTKEGR
jgi:hypothetical protein